MDGWMDGWMKAWLLAIKRVSYELQILYAHS